MKPAKRAGFILLVMMTIFLLFPFTAVADDDDFSFGVRVYPEVAGYKGGDIKLSITITNPTIKDITWVDFGVNTASPHGERHFGTDGVPAFCYRTFSITVHFAPEDLDVNKKLTVAINNDFDEFRDGSQTKTIRVDGTRDIVNIVSTPEPCDFEVGETVTIMHQLNSNMTQPLTNAQLQSFLLGDEDQHLVDSPVSHYDAVEADSHAVTSTTYQLTSSDVGQLTGAYDIEYTYLGESYHEVGFAYSYVVAEPLNPNFTATLSAPFTSADAGTLTNLTLEINNTGNVGFGSFYIEAPDGTHIANGGSVGPGSDIRITIPFSFHDYGEWNVRYIVTGDYGPDEHSENTNTLHMVCEAPALSSPSATSTATVESAASALPSAEDALADDDTANAAATQALKINTEEKSSDAAMQTQRGGNTLLYIIIAFLGAIIIAGAITIPLLLRKRKSGK